MNIVYKEKRVAEIEEHIEILLNTNSKHSHVVYSIIDFWYNEIAKIEKQILDFMTKDKEIKKVIVS
mgnify:CR=1 FL=1|tara:strand:+ start:283 stop:480 length:198 start_codon:yes stop_codon:yes gene_type:complete